MSKQNIKAGLFGFGTVGEGIYRLLEDETDPAVTIDKIVVKNRNKQRSLSKEHFHFDKHEILDDPDIPLVIELISDADEAWEIAKATLEKGKSLVTANKKMVALHLEELYELQQKYKGHILYEAAACGAIPAVQTVDQYLSRDEISSISGIFNGTSNYILSQISNGSPYEQALKEAQEKGFAEADPTLDVDGYDATFKLTLLAAHAFGQFLPPLEVPRLGIRQAGVPEYLFGNSHNYQLKLVARAERRNGVVHGYVLPAFVNERNPLFHVRGEDNSVLIEAKAAGPLQLNGKGAGAFPTAQAVRGDINRWKEGIRYRYPSGLAVTEHTAEDGQMAVYVRARNTDALEQISFSNISETTQTSEYAFRVGEIAHTELVAIAHSTEDLFIATLPEDFGVRSENHIKREQLVEI